LHFIQYVVMLNIYRGRRGGDRIHMVVGCITTYAMSAIHH